MNCLNKRDFEQNGLEAGGLKTFISSRPAQAVINKDANANSTKTERNQPVY